jgi:hypothetical protein
MGILQDSSEWIALALVGSFGLVFGLVVFFGTRRDASMFLVVLEYFSALLATTLLCYTWFEPILLVLLSCGLLLTAFHNPLHLLYSATLGAMYISLFTMACATARTNYIALVLVGSCLLNRGRELYIIHIEQKPTHLND